MNLPGQSLVQNKYVQNFKSNLQWVNINLEDSTLKLFLIRNV